MSKGIQLSTTRNPIQGDASEYDSRRRRLQVALNHDPAHLKIGDIGPGTALTSNAGNGYRPTEVLYSIKHGLPYRPKVLVYFYRYDTSSYGVGKLFYGLGAINDYLEYEVDETTFTITHILDDTAFNAGYTSTAPAAGPIRLKFMILSIPVNKLIEELTT